MPVRCTALLAALAAVMLATSARAGWFSDFCHSCNDDIQRRNCWPEPYLSADREAAQAPFCAMIAKGWERQNMLVDQHFEEGNTRLNEAGRLKVRWILFQAPTPHRAIYVHQTIDNQTTALRVDAVQQLVVQAGVDPSSVPILVTTLDPADNPADRIDIVTRKFRDMAPPPLLPKGGGSDSGSSGSSSSSAPH